MKCWHALFRRQQLYNDNKRLWKPWQADVCQWWFVALERLIISRTEAFQLVMKLFWNLDFVKLRRDSFQAVRVFSSRVLLTNSLCSISISLEFVFFFFAFSDKSVGMFAFSDKSSLIWRVKFSWMIIKNVVFYIFCLCSKKSCTKHEFLYLG